MAIPANILVVDDEVQLLEIYQRMISRLGHSVVTVDNPRNAIQMYSQAQTEGKDFDLVIMDLTMPGDMKGKDAVNHLRSIDPAVPVIASSGYANDPVMHRCTDYGFQDTILKPFSIETLDKTIRKAARKT